MSGTVDGDSGGPRCRKCGSRTRLKATEPHPNPGFRADRRTYQCVSCGAERVEIVEREG